MSDSESSAEPPVCSVVIPAYNAAATVDAAIRSALSQTRSDLEVIVIDDGSTDTTAEVAEQIGDPRVRVLSQPNRGLPAARNAGIRAARGTYVAFLDSDDLWLPSYLDLATRALAAINNPGFAYTDAYTFEPVTGKVYRHPTMHRMHPPVPPPADAAGFLLELLKRNFVYVSTVVPRSVLDEVGGFDESRTSVEDYELWLRILVAGHPAAWVPGQHALYRMHGGQMSSRLTTMYQNVADVYASLRLEDMPTVAHRELLESRRQWAQRELAALEGKSSLHGLRRRVSHTLGRIRLRSGLGGSWYEAAPPEVAAAFPDLTAV
jgi:glycosyltransferase involved in cell wall biosynthesis